MTSHQPNRVQLTAAATRALPRWILLAICVVYGLAGLFGRDPWKNDDVVGFGVMWSMAQGEAIDWLTPNIAGRPVFQAAPLAYWPGALAIRVFGPWLGAADAARIATALLFFGTCALIWYGTYLLGRRAEVQPFAYVFGGQPEARDYGRTLADGALLVFLACVGIAQRGHETTPEVMQLFLMALLLYGLIRSLDQPRQGMLIAGLALGLLGLAASPLPALMITLGAVGAARASRPLSWRALLPALPLALALASIWPLWLMFAAQGKVDLNAHLLGWLDHDLQRFGVAEASSLLFTARNLPLFAWPLWPLALWTWLSWRGLRRQPHVALPLAMAASALILILMQRQTSDVLFMLLAPPLAVLAAFGLPTLKRAVINAMDWFALLFFTLLGGFVWVVWLAQATGFPAQTARNLDRLLPGLQSEFSLPALVGALVITAAWVLIVRWRLSRAPQVLWRSVVISAAGTTLMWVLMMTLWLPTINYAKTYRDVALAAARALPEGYRCIQPIRVGDAQLASFAYFAGMRFGDADDECDVLLRHDPRDFGAPTSVSTYQWMLIWEGHRPADRDERFRLYQLRVRDEAAPAAEAGGNDALGGDPASPNPRHADAPSKQAD